MFHSINWGGRGRRRERVLRPQISYQWPRRLRKKSVGKGSWWLSPQENVEDLGQDVVVLLKPNKKGELGENLKTFQRHCRKIFTKKLLTISGFVILLFYKIIIDFFLWLRLLVTSSHMKPEYLHTVKPVPWYWNILFICVKPKKVFWRMDGSGRKAAPYCDQQTRKLPFFFAPLFMSSSNCCKR